MRIFFAQKRPDICLNTCKTERSVLHIKGETKGTIIHSHDISARHYSTKICWHFIISTSNKMSPVKCQMGSVLKCTLTFHRRKETGWFSKLCSYLKVSCFNKQSHYPQEPHKVLKNRAVVSE